MPGGLVKRYWGYCGNSFTESEFLRFWTIFYTDYGEPALFPRSVNFLSRWKFTTRVGRIRKIKLYIYISYILICWWKNLILRKYRPICQRNIRNKKNPWNGSMSVDWNQKKRVKWKAHASCRNFIEESTGCSTGNTRTPSRPLPTFLLLHSIFPSLSLSFFRAHPAASRMMRRDKRSTMTQEKMEKKGCSWSLGRVQRQTSGPVRYWVSNQVSNIEENASRRRLRENVLPFREKLVRFLPTIRVEFSFFLLFDFVSRSY